MGPASWEGHESEERSAHPGKPLVGELSLDRRRASFSVEENMATRVWQQDSESCKLGAEPCPAHPV